ncbi:hypothetical protein P148_SR1C00001G0308 [candidate division SR1 bacterium RAAC1_SR1_1]|nr:hypothetical protein P148_SR1C00001G0308 [candidate division SR1 bacterium RAAC1_SR1_1]
MILEVNYGSKKSANKTLARAFALVPAYAA